MVQGVVAHSLHEGHANLPDEHPPERVLAPESEVQFEGRVSILCPLYGDVSMDISDVCLGSSAAVSCHMFFKRCQ